jgi:hypothetical protein
MHLFLFHPLAVFVFTLHTLIHTYEIINNDGIFTWSYFIVCPTPLDNSGGPPPAATEQICADGSAAGADGSCN